ncbi:uncharacterized protein LOC111070747 [Drosophila obscura]|uniref:uncharacterized protein LOC111070747 n=1 Tax=Drosophila obscura TaxID=7282 RepID=UPI001BB1E479|nr:uncharacterized protein LOC111070747 [Drosophila obscura]
MEDTFGEDVPQLGGRACAVEISDQNVAISDSMKHMIYQGIEANPLSGKAKATDELNAEEEQDSDANSTLSDSNEGVNPFAYSMNEEQPPVEHEDSGLDGDEKMSLYLHRLSMREAIPRSCLTDAVFMMDKPVSAMTVGQELRRLPMNKVADCQVKKKIVVTNVYSPFQFWFQFAESNDVYDLAGLSCQISEFYRTEATYMMSQYQNPVGRFFLRPGYICAAHSRWGLRRARIVSAPQENATHVSVFYVDYGRLEEIACSDLRFLPKAFAHMPAMAVRGTLSHVHPLGSIWPTEVTEEFRQIVISHETYAHIIEEDLEEEIYFIKIYETKTSTLSINSLMIQQELAGESDHFDENVIKESYGRRRRYLCELLPSFEMLETGVFPMDADLELENNFNKIVKESVRDFSVPNISNPFLRDLEQALLKWMEGYKRKETYWRKLYREAKLKAKEEEKLHENPERLQAIKKLMDKDKLENADE